MLLRKTKANKDEECIYCGYPFDTGDDCLIDESSGTIYCSRNCASMTQIDDCGLSLG